MTAFSSRFISGPRPAAIRRRSAAVGNGIVGGWSALWRKKTPPTTLWIGLCMSCLVILYVAIVVAVTRIHMHNNSQQQEVAVAAAAAARDPPLAGAAVGDAPRQQPRETPKKRTSDLHRPPNPPKQKSLRHILGKVQEDAAAKKVATAKKKQERQEALLLASSGDSVENAAAAGGRNSTNDEDAGGGEKKKKKKRAGDVIDPHVLLPHNEAEDALPVAVREDPPDDYEHPTPDNILTAYIERIDYDHWWNSKPLANRTETARADRLTSVKYPRLNSCSRLPQQFPVDDTPAESDPFLPWIHDVFPTADGKFIQIVAQNRRRCRTGAREKDIIRRMNPQAAIFQHISVRRIQSDRNQSAAAAAGEEGGGGGGGGGGSDEDEEKPSPRYRLCLHDEADPDGLATRFICRFKPDMQETLSVYNFDYDWTSYRKRYKGTFVEDDGGIYSIHTSQLIFKCPVPPKLQELVRSGLSVQEDWASIFLDVIPIRTPPRFGLSDQYLQPRYSEFVLTDPGVKFDALAAYGRDHVIPAVEDSGRWENLPVCKPSLMTYENQKLLDLPRKGPEASHQNKHHLVSCLWASAGYATRGERFAVNDGQRRLLEWITYNRMIGFDHFYLYDNSGANANTSDAVTSLKPIADLFPDHVTYIPWPSAVCNNRPNNVDSPGERSSQYAAEASCRLRFGPHVHWIGQFDIDEYLVPMGNHSNVLTVLEHLDRQDTRIVSFGSWRAWPRWSLIEKPVVPIRDRDVCWNDRPCFRLRIPPNTTMLQGYNCDRQPPGHKEQQMPAEKQLYRADYVTQHFVHYAAATVLSEKNRTEYLAEGFRWKRRAFPDPRQRFANELTEGLMLHTKAVAHQDTAGWETYCHIDHHKLPKRKRGMCRLGIPWPAEGTTAAAAAAAAAARKTNATADGWAYNCYVNEKVERDLVPRLEKELESKAHLFFGVGADGADKKNVKA